MIRDIVAVITALSLSAQQPATVFRVDVKLVQILVTIYDGRGRYLDGLTKDSFEVFDNSSHQELTTFEAASVQSSPLSCALLLDVTGSMKDDLPTVKNAAIRFIDGLRPVDSVAVYAFNSRLIELQSFTQDHAVAQQAVLRTRPAGRTAVFDALSETAAQVARRTGRKAIIVFTDGNDNTSLLTPQSASQRAKKAGVPIYTIAEGEAKRVRKFAEQLENIAQITGGLSFETDGPKKLDEIFRHINEDLKHVYMLAYIAPPSAPDVWHAIQVKIRGPKDYRVRAREGYFGF